MALICSSSGPRIVFCRSTIHYHKSSWRLLRSYAVSLAGWLAVASSLTGKRTMSLIKQNVSFLGYSRTTKHDLLVFLFCVDWSMYFYYFPVQQQLHNYPRCLNTTQVKDRVAGGWWRWRWSWWKEGRKFMGKEKLTTAWNWCYTKVYIFIWKPQNGPSDLVTLPFDQAFIIRIIPVIY